MITSAQYNDLTEPAEPGAVRAMLYACDDGSYEFMPLEGGEFQIIECDDPRIFPLAGGRVTGRRVKSLHDRA